MACDQTAETRYMIAQSHSVPPGDIYSDISAPLDWDHNTLYAAGPPCQGLAPLGDRLGWEDPRTQL